MKTDGATKRVSEYIKHRRLNLSDMARQVNIPYSALYNSLFNEKRDRDLRVDEFLTVCKYLDVDQMIFWKPCVEEE